MTSLLSPEIATAPELTERCDRCGAAAKLQATLPAGELAFCGHHANKYAPELNRSAVRIDLEDGFEWTGKVPGA